MCHLLTSLNDVMDDIIIDFDAWVAHQLMEEKQKLLAMRKGECGAR